jgi:hypothetical protein
MGLNDLPDAHDKGDVSNSRRLAENAETRRSKPLGPRGWREELNASAIRPDHVWDRAFVGPPDGPRQAILVEFADLRWRPRVCRQHLGSL